MPEQGTQNAETGGVMKCLHCGKERATEMCGACQRLTLTLSPEPFAPQVSKSFADSKKMLNKIHSIAQQRRRRSHNA